MPVRIAVGGCFLGLILFGDLFAQTSPVQEARLSSIAAGARAQVRSRVEAAAQVGLPVEPILDLAREYTLKGVPAERIVSAVGLLHDRLVRSRSVLGLDAGPEDVKAGAEAIRVGIDSASLVQLRAQRGQGDEPLWVSLGVVADIVEAGVPRDTAITIVHRLLAAGARNSDLVAYRMNVESDIALGAPPSAAAAVRGEASLATDFNVSNSAAGPARRPTSTIRRIPPA